MIYNGIYPTMITPYRDGKIDFKNVEKLVSWYIENGCHGIFAVCQSSEMNFLSLKERKELAKKVVEFSEGKLSVVVSGHCDASLDAQAEEIASISECGADSFVLVSNRLDIHNLGDDVWIENAEKLLEKLPENLRLGIYECPMPYKRLLTPKILEWCKSTGRFDFIKDTCCNPDMLKKRLIQLKDSSIKLFNANEQTFLHSLKHGGEGYSGIMANFHPDLLVWLFENFENQPEKSEILSDALSMSAFTESPAYPSTAKHYLSYEGFDMDIFSRSSSPENLTSYQKLVMEQLYRHNERLRKFITEV
ncbi:MAG: dihydrodipicolinate synthase family protein [Clostridia bacterium]|nr:dihydrodipicolinate synthase family protein [Clostridia bacterium]